MNKSDVTALLVGLGLAGVVIFAYEKGYLKIPTTQTITSTPRVLAVLAVQLLKLRLVRRLQVVRPLRHHLVLRELLQV